MAKGNSAERAYNSHKTDNLPPEYKNAGLLIRTIGREMSELEKHPVKLLPGEEDELRALLEKPKPTEIEGPSFVELIRGGVQWVKDMFSQPEPDVQRVIAQLTAPRRRKHENSQEPLTARRTRGALLLNSVVK